MANTLIKDNWTISFLWRPESSWREVHGVLPIATVRMLDNSYVTLSYEATYDVSDNRTGGKFVLADGTNTIEITANDGWLFADVLKFAIVHEGGVTLYVETPAEGMLAGTDVSMAFDDYLNFVQFSANASGEVKGIGAYGDCQIWDNALDETNIQKVFNLDPTAPAATLIQRADQMAFSRDSEAYRLSFVSEEKIKITNNGIRDIINKPVFCQLTPAFNETIRNRHILLWSDGNKIVSATSRTVYETDDALNFSQILSLSQEPFATDCANGEYTYLNYVICSGYKLDNGVLLLNARNSSDNTSLLWRYDPISGAWNHVLTMKGYLEKWGWQGVRGSEIVIGEYGPRSGAEEYSKRIYYSPNYGATWSIIHTIAKTSTTDLHIHFTTWHPTHTNTIYVSTGDDRYRQLLMLEFIGPDKTDSASWSASNLGLNIQPTSSLVFGDKLIFGLDGDSMETGTFSLFDPDTSRETSLLQLYLFDSTSGLYLHRSNETYIWCITRVNGIYYAAAYRDGSESNGLYASQNGFEWTRIYKGVITFVMGDETGRLWLQASNGITTVPFLVNQVSNRSISFAYCRRSFTNVLSADNSYMKLSIGDWYHQDTANVISSGLSNEYSVFGANSYKSIITDYIRARLYLTLTAGKAYVWSAFLRLPDEIIGWYQDSKTRPYLRIDTFTSSGIIKPTIISNFIRVFENWYYGQCWFLVTETNTSGVMIQIIPKDFVFPPEGLPIYIDGAQLVELDDNDIHYSGQFQPGGTPRAAEILVASALGGGGAGGGDAGGRLFRGLL